MTKDAWLDSRDGGDLWVERSYLTQIEACVSCLEEDVMAELAAVRTDLNIITRSMAHSVTPSSPAATNPPKALQLFRKRLMQLSIGETYVPDNPVKAEILQDHVVTE